MNIRQIELEYREFRELKKRSPAFADALVLGNQRILTAAGRVHALCLRHGEQGLVEYDRFTHSFAGSYYQNWRKSRAVSMAHCFDIYEQLGVQMDVKNCVGETFYAGIPPLTQEELDTARAEARPYRFIVFSQKIGVDGEYHDVDANGDFRPVTDLKDVYGDGSMVGNEKLKNFT